MAISHLHIQPLINNPPHLLFRSMLDDINFNPSCMIMTLRMWLHISPN